jgi:hypothetical protein
MKLINALCGQIAQILIVGACVTYRYHRAVLIAETVHAMSVVFCTIHYFNLLRSCDDRRHSYFY